MPRLTLVALLFALAGVLSAAVPSTTVEMLKRGNVRYGPSLKATVITTLESGTQVQVFGAVPGRDGWYQIRFPRQGHAWAHSKVLQATDDPKAFKVIVDGARVRADSRINADLVTELAFGEIVESKGRKVGNWLAIYPPNAVAYVYHSVLGIGPDVERRIEEVARALDEQQLAWEVAQARYRHYRKAYQANADQALGHDWSGLDAELARITGDEGYNIRARLTAQKLREGIVQVASASRVHLAKSGLDPVADPDFAGQIRAAAMKQANAAAQPAPTRPVSTGTPTAAPATPATPADTSSQPATPVAGGGASIEGIDDPDSVLAAPGGGMLAGFMEQGDDPGVGSTFVLYDGSGAVIAYCKATPGSGINLSEYYWRMVEVQGSTDVQNVGGKDLVVVTVESIRLQ
jgi:hypothetical protein